MATDDQIGSDLSCTLDLDPRGMVVTGRRLLAEAIFRRLITPRGSLIDDPNYGTDVTAWINDDVSPSDVEKLRAAIVAECKKDERVETTRVTIVAPPSGSGAYAITIGLRDADGPFSLTMSVADAGAELVGVDEAA